MNLWLLGGGEGTVREFRMDRYSLLYLKWREFGMDRYTLLYLKWITNKVLLYSPGNSTQCYVAAWMEGEFEGRMDICICMAESLR